MSLEPQCFYCRKAQSKCECKGLPAEKNPEAPNLDDLFFNPNMKLEKWLDLVQQLIQSHGPNAIMYIGSDEGGIPTLEIFKND